MLSLEMNLHFTVFHAIFVLKILINIISRNESICKADPGQAVALSVCDCRIYYDGSVIQEKRGVKLSQLVRNKTGIP